MKNEFDALYRDNGKSYVDLKQAYVNNGYILYYTNETVRNVESIQELTDRLVEKISLKDFPDYAQYFDANITSENYLNEVVGQLEYSLEYLTGTIQGTKHNLLLGIAVQYLIEAVFNKFTRAYANAYGQVTEDIFYGSQIQALFDPDSEFQYKKISVFKKLKLMPKVFKQMAKNVPKYFTNKWRSLKKWQRINSWKGFKGKMLHTLRKPLAKIAAVKKIVESSKAMRHGIRNFKLSWSQRITHTLGIIGDAISIYLNVNEWRKVRDEMAKAKNKYEEYKRQLTVEMGKTRIEANNLQTGWVDSSDNFISITESIRTLFADLSENLAFNGVMGLGGLPVNFVDSYLPANFKIINKGNLLSKQSIVINFLKDIDNDLTKIRDKLNAQLIMYENIETGVAENRSIVEMLQTLKNIYEYKTGEEKTFGTLLSDKTLVCAVTVKYPEKTEYDFYSLTSLRPRCEVTGEQFSSIKAKALEKRKKAPLMSIVKAEVSKTKSITVEHLLNLVKNVYLYSSDEIIKHYGDSITERDVTCAVATQFPSMSSFNSLLLAPFRPDCRSVSDLDFADMKKAVVNKKLIAEKVKVAMTICESWGFCPCIADIITQLEGNGERTSESDIKIAITTIRPGKTQYCATKCPCVNLITEQSDMSRINAQKIKQDKPEPVDSQETRVRKVLVEKIKGLLDTHQCNNWGLCPCFRTILAFFQNEEATLSEDNVKDAIKEVWPDKTQYCSLGCQCITL